MKAKKWSLLTLAALAAGACEQGQDPVGPGPELFEIAAVTVPEVAIFTVQACKEGGAGPSSFTVSGTAQVAFPAGPSFTLVDDECKVVAEALDGGQSVTVTETAPATGTTFQKVDQYSFIGSQGVFEGIPTFVATFSTPSVTIGRFGNDQGHVLVFTNVDVPQEDGCTHTQGFWKTHPQSWPAGFDPDDLFGTSATKTWLDTFWTPPAGGNAYFILAHQYMAAVLSDASGAAVPANVQSAIDGAAAFFASAPYGVKPTGATRTQLLAWAGLLDSYNNGNEGVDHCD
jgi:hypothetical protein